MSTIRRRAYAAVQGGELFFHLKKLGRFNQRAVQFYAAQVRAALHLYAVVRGGRLHVPMPAAQMTLALEHIHTIDVVYRSPRTLLRPRAGAAG